MKVSGQPYPSATLRSVKQPPVPVEQVSLSGRFGEQKNLSPLPGFEFMYV